MPASQRWVATRAIQAAVKDREAEVLDALGIPWREGRPHIRCPYPTHADGDPSWRWDERKARARCTCSRGDSIFDVVMKLEGIDFDAAKLRVAELLGRHDLIQEADRPAALPGHRCRQPAAAAAGAARRRPAHGLPGPSPGCAGRAGAAPRRPRSPASRRWPTSTRRRRAAGPSRSWSAAIPARCSRTFAADGRRHAHRIYVAPGGRRQGGARHRSRTAGRAIRRSRPRSRASRAPPAAPCSGAIRPPPRICC